MEQHPNDKSTKVIQPSLLSDGIMLTKKNSRLRCFEDTTLDHVEYTNDEGKLVGMRVGRAFLDLLFERNFPYRFNSTPDEATIDWYVRTEPVILNEELDDLLGDE